MPRNVISINEAIDLISATISLAEENKKESPYFIIEGAGISCPEIPVASEIINHCKKIVKQRYSANDAGYARLIAESDSLLSKGMKYYSFWIEKAFPNKADRSNFFKGLITNSKISAATLLLAQIIYSKRITTTVFTTNFDENLEKALNLFGTEELFIADNPRDNLALEVDSATIQVAHLHGTYRFYDCANLESEIQEVTSSSDFTSAAFALRTFLLAKAPIIIGYSGWEGDVIMNCIEERIQHSLPYNYFWVCFCKEDYNRIPDKLKQNLSIFFVVPENEKASQLTSDVASMDFQYDQSQAPLIPATLFFGKLVSKLGIVSPTLLSNPSLYFSELIKKTLPDNEDVFHLKKWAERMGAKGASESEGEKHIHLLELASAKKDFSTAVNLINKLASDVTLGASDYSYILQSVIMQLVQQEAVMTEAALLFDFRDASLNFIRSHRLEICNNETYETVLGRILAMPPTANLLVGSRLVKIALEINELLKEDRIRATVRFRALRVLSVWSDKEEERISWLNQIIGETTDIKKFDETVKLYRCNALIDRVSYLNDYQDRIKDLREAKKIAEEGNNEYVKMRVIKSQVSLGNICEDPEERRKLQENALRKALAFDHEVWRKDILEVIGEVFNSKDDHSQISKKELRGVFGFFDELEQISFKTAKDAYEYADALTSMLSCLTKEQDFVRVSQKILSLEEVLDGKLRDLFDYHKALALYCLVCKTQGLVEPEKYIEYVKQFKLLSQKEDIGSSIYFEALGLVQDDNRIKLLHGSGFSDDIVHAIQIKSIENNESISRVSEEP